MDPPVMAPIISSFISCLSFNVFLIGDSRVGKSTFIELLQKKTTDVSIKPYRGTILPDLRTLYFKDESVDVDKDICLNILDTPGLDEVTADGNPSRPNEELHGLISEHVKNYFSSINLILITVQNKGITDKTIDTIFNIQKYFGDRYRDNLCLLITHCDDMNEDEEKALLNQIMLNSAMKSFITAIKQRVLFTGRNSDDSSIKNYDFIQRQQRRKVMFLKTLRSSINTSLKNINDLNNIKPIDILESAAATNMIILSMSDQNQRDYDAIVQKIVDLNNLNLNDADDSVRKVVVERTNDALKAITLIPSTPEEKKQAREYNDYEIPLKKKALDLKETNYELKTHLKVISTLFDRFHLKTIKQETQSPIKKVITSIRQDDIDI